jgi:eukaryotic-like serine/threonine-protein kinase
VVSRPLSHCVRAFDPRTIAVAVKQPVPFGKYLLLDRISVGGMAEVYKAKSYGVEGFEKIIAIKRILPSMGEDRDFIKMFIDEAKIAGQLAHSNICQIFELGRIDGSHFIAMEFIWGKDLLQIQNRLRKSKQLMPVAMACYSLSRVCEGLDYAHRKKNQLGKPMEIVHRDCSPQNVLVSYEGEVKVIDFGIAKASSSTTRTQAGVLKGKFGYMSPEQVRGLPLDRRSDIFALGTMLFECLTGTRLFQGETDFATLEKVRNVTMPSPRSLNSAIPEVVEKIIMKALTRDPDERYQWCSEMQAELQSFLMSQSSVFTAKTMAAAVREMFAAEVEREKQLLEQYKMIGRHNAVPKDADPAPNPGDSGPSFEEADMMGTDLLVSGEPRESSAARKLAESTTPMPMLVRTRNQSSRDEDFVDEAPTELFGDEHATLAEPISITSPDHGLAHVGMNLTPASKSLVPKATLPMSTARPTPSPRPTDGLVSDAASTLAFSMSAKSERWRAVLSLIPMGNHPWIYQLNAVRLRRLHRQTRKMLVRCLA